MQNKKLPLPCDDLAWTLLYHHFLIAVVVQKHHCISLVVGMHLIQVRR